MSVVVQLRGGLGNQLFQYAAGYSLSRRLGEGLLLDTALLPLQAISRGGVRRWTEQLSGFAHDGDLVDTAGSSSLKRRVRQSLAGKERALGDSALGGILGHAVYAHETRDDLDQFGALTSGARINAYCNSPHFFAPDGAAIRHQVTSLIAPSDWYLTEKRAIEDAGAIALHVRWGDYLNLRRVYGTISPAYYRRSVEIVARKRGDAPIWLFSDDPKGAADYLEGAVDIARVIEPPSQSTALENLLLLGSASAFVCANSSFSWWGAYLASAPSGSVVFPRPLFAESGPPEPKDWLLSDWIQVGRD